jgi:hypothetical protein
MTKPKPSPAEPSGETPAGEEGPILPLAEPVPATLDDLDGRIEGTGPTDPAGAIRALPLTPPPTPEGSGDKHPGGRPKGRKTGQPNTGERATNAPSSSGTSAPRPANASTARSPRERDVTKAELQSEVEALRARVAAQTATGPSSEDLEKARSAILGILAIANIGADFSELPEFVHTDPEGIEIADAGKKPLAPYLASAGKYADLAVFVAVVAKVEWPKLQAYKARKDREVEEARVRRLTAGRIGIDVPMTPPVRPEPVPSAATLSGGYTP